MQSKIGIDLGGTKIEGVLLNRKNEVVKRKRIPTRQENGYDFILNQIYTLSNELKSSTDQETSVGICTPGALSLKTGLIKNSNTQCLNGRALKKDLEELIGVEIKMENDANCFALAEAVMGAGQGFHSVFGVIIGTGVGGGIVIDGKLLVGKNHIAGEWGHNVLKPDGDKCYCGKAGCVETVISGPALENRWEELAGEKMKLEEIIRVNERDGNDKYWVWKTHFINYFGKSLSMVINILDPDVIILGGGVANISFLYCEGAARVQNQVFSDACETPVIQNQLGDSAGVFGAALL